jgi:hypothetical protein
MAGVLRMGALAQGILNRIKLYRKVTSGVTKTTKGDFIFKKCSHSLFTLKKNQIFFSKALK